MARNFGIDKNWNSDVIGVQVFSGTYKIGYVDCFSKNSELRLPRPVTGKKIK
jgi:hypothetical protein